MKRFLLALLLIPFFLYSEIRETTRFADLLDEVDSDTLVLIDLDDTLIDSSVSLWSSTWRRWVKENYKGQKDPISQIPLHDYYTYIAAIKVPVKPVEKDIPAIVAALQAKNCIVICFTARGVDQWYTSRIEGIDALSKQQLASIGISFVSPNHPEAFTGLPIYSDGIIFGGSMFGGLKDREKGSVLKEIFLESNYFPKNVVFIDDKESQVLSVEMAMQELGIPILGLWYRHIEKSQRDFDPETAAIQWKKLIEEDILLSDDGVKQLQKS